MKLRMELNDKGLRQGFSDFRTANKIAVRNTLNEAARLTRRNAVDEVKKDFTLRNSFTVKSIVYDKVETNDISKMRSHVGALQRAPYMELQEKGGRRPRKGAVTAIPQVMARQGKSKSRPVMKAKYISKIKSRLITGRVKKVKGNSRYDFVARMAVAYEKNFYIKRRNAIYFVRTFHSDNGKVKVNLERLYYSEKKPITIKKETWLQPSIKRPSENIGKIYRGQLRKLWKYDALK